MKTNEWEKQLRERLADYQEPAGDDILAAIESRIGVGVDKRKEPSGLHGTAKEKEHRRTEKATELRRTTTVIRIRRWTAAAAVAMILIAGAGLIYRQGTAENISAGSTTTTNKMTVAEMTAKDETDAYKDNMPLSDKATGTPSTSSLPDVTSASSATSVPSPSSISDATSSTSSQDTSSVLPATASNGSRQDRDQHAPLPHSDLNTSHDDSNQYIRTGRKKSTPRISIGLMASNGMSDNSMSGEHMMMSPESMLVTMVRGNSYDIKSEEPMFLSNYKETTDHHQPISFGLSLRYRLWKRLWAETGLQYTYLRSDFDHRLGTVAYTDRQHLHYLGVPFRLGCEVFSWGGLSLYASAGAQADFCLAASIDTNGTEHDINRDRTQMSADIAIGLQYSFLPRLGLYAEPCIRYYFDNGSPLKNYFKEHKECFNLRVGIRVDL